MAATSATAASPLCGSTDPRPVNTSGCSRQAAATVSFGTRGRPVAVSASQASSTARTPSPRYRPASWSSDPRCTGDLKYASAASTYPAMLPSSQSGVGRCTWKSMARGGTHPFNPSRTPARAGSAAGPRGIGRRPGASASVRGEFRPAGSGRPDAGIPDMVPGHRRRVRAGSARSQHRAGKEVPCGLLCSGRRGM